MKKRRLFILSLLSLGGIMIFGWLTGNDDSLLKPGTSAPDFQLTAHDGSTVRLSDFLGKKNVVLVFYPLDASPA